MSTVNSAPHSAVQQLIEQRLDAIDGALLGLLPRQDRLAAVAQVEIRIRELAAANLELPAQGLPLPISAFSSGGTNAPAAVPNSQIFGGAFGGWFPSTRKKRSRLAVTAGVLGILSLALMLATPITYVVVAMLQDFVGEFVAIAIVGTHALALALGGVTAMGLGLAALVTLRRCKGQLAGHGWAIAGLCAGPMPLLLGIAAVLFVGVEMGAAEFFAPAEPQVAGAASSSTIPPSPDENGPPALSDSPDSIESSPPVWYPGPVQPAGHETPLATNPPPVAGVHGDAPTPSACPPALPQSDPANQPELPRPANPQTATPPEPPIEPGEMPESAPAI